MKTLGFRWLFQRWPAPSTLFQMLCQNFVLVRNCCVFSRLALDFAAPLSDSF